MLLVLLLLLYRLFYQMYKLSDFAKVCLVLVHNSFPTVIFSDWARVDWGDKCWSYHGTAGIHVWTGLERPLRDIHSQLATVDWWSATADAPAARGGFQSGFRGAVHIWKALPPPPTKPLQPCAASPPLCRCGDQCTGYNELWTGRPPVGAILWYRYVSV